VNATEIVLSNSSSSNIVFRDNVDMTLASSIYTKFYSDGTPNTSLASIIQDLAYLPPLACTDISLTSYGIWYRLSTKGISGISSTCYNLTARTSSPQDTYLNLAVFKGDSCPVPLDPSTLDASIETTIHSYGIYGYGYNRFVDNVIPYSCVTESSYNDAIGTSTIKFPVDMNETYYIFAGSSYSFFGNVSLSLTVRTEIKNNCSIRLQTPQ
jgi:hypothetical protein